MPTQDIKRTARLATFPAPEGVSSMWHWHRRVPLWRVARNFLVVYSCRYCASLRVKNSLYRTLGIKVGVRVSVGLGATMDVFFPQLISIGDNTIVGYNTVILAHEFLIGELRTGPVEIGRDVMIGANATILAGVRIGDGATVSACSLVNRDIPAGALAGGVPARVLFSDRSAD
jgi:acetyltransferase-like isoleucine patch superfamily enzyme